ncbi:MAG: hypothetical protein GXY41_05295 [Phycisphaerae bacterium]|nr:hypothetical protein [Phycisphaerae bacterium]
MQERKQILGIITLAITFLASGLLLVISFLYYERGEFGRTIFNFGSAMLVGMFSTAGIIYLRLKGHLLSIEKLLERIENKG